MNIELFWSIWQWNQIYDNTTSCFKLFQSASQVTENDEEQKLARKQVAFDELVTDLICKTYPLGCVAIKT
jgi:hypothetical protein